MVNSNFLIGSDPEFFCIDESTIILIILCLKVKNLVEMYWILFLSESFCIFSLNLY